MDSFTVRSIVMRTRKTTLKASFPTIIFEGFKFLSDVLRLAPALITQSCVSATPIPAMPCLDDLNDCLLQDNNESWAEEELEATMFPSEPSCLDF
jgi:hypothetical protein